MAERKIFHLRDTGDILLIRNPRAKRLIIRVRPLQGVRVTVPGGVSFARAEQVVRIKAEWIRTQTERMKKMEPRYRLSLEREAAIDRREAKRILAARLDHIARHHGFTYNRVTVRSQKTRWGSCSGAGNISLNIKLLLLPEELRDYILLHELVHTRIKNHGPGFWAELLRVEPQAVEMEAQLRQYCPHLL